MHPPAPARSVYFAGWAPDGKRVAFSANWETGVYHLLVAPFKQGKLGDPKPLAAIRACEVAWRPDGRELAIVQSDADCSRHGVVTRVNPGKPNKLIPVKEGIENPAWSPVGRRR
jgi:Tol biopolymer transport system component